jgi:hypothetical protein
MADDAPQLRGEPRKLSSVHTEIGAVVGFLLASLWTLGVLLTIVLGKTGAGVALLAVGMTAVVWLAILAGRPKMVETDGYWLLVTNFSKTVWIPLGQIVSVSQTGFPGGQRVHVELACDTPFGQEITFEPQFGLGPLIGEHPVVEELRALAAAAKRDGQR